ncbi:MAG: adenine phosphoribosyltransferase [Gloeomargarita sp. SKYBB_i_bin120]|nr:adenine phosphoribosyltransferase [Gloeomargarita sp. SKYG98]MCS7291783.1 adenine phosphoribosyltransferase [Gloeomargarita sp. SKYB120]MDW8177343.1 adenine phosphoribosyltransferase [Gloeomargarita sp. SKYBB_i_bin120]
MDLKALIREIPDFPQPGILFRDITTLLAHPEGLRYTIDELARRFRDHQVDVIVGPESRGFIFGVPLAYALGCGFVPVRKPGKLPGPVHRREYALEYGTDQLEIHQDGIQPGQRVLVVDDLLATGGTARAVGELVQQAQGELIGFGFIIELAYLGGRKRLPDTVIETLVTYE